MSLTHPATNHPHPKTFLAICVFWLLLLAIFTTMLYLSLRNNAIGTDFYTFWVAEKSLFLDHLNPYSDTVTQASQVGIYGKLARPDQDQVAFAYPVYSLFLTAPTAWMSYPWAISFWIALNVLTLLTILFLLFSQGPKYLLISALFFYPISFGLILGNFAIPLGTILLFIFYFLVIKRTTLPAIQISAGVLLAWATIKPQFVLFFVGYCIVFAIRKKLWPFLITFFGALAVELLLAQWLVPSWILDWTRRVFEYAQYVQSQPTLQFLLSAFLPNPLSVWISRAGMLVTGGFSLVLLAAWWRDKLDDLSFLAWIGMATYLFHPHGIAYEQITFLVPFFLWAATANRKHPRAVMAFWTITLVYSWLAFAFGRLSLAVDRSPVLLNAVFVIWLLLQADWQLIRHDIGGAIQSIFRRPTRA